MLYLQVFQHILIRNMTVKIARIVEKIFLSEVYINVSLMHEPIINNGSTERGMHEAY